MSEETLVVDVTAMSSGSPFTLPDEDLPEWVLALRQYWAEHPIPKPVYSCGRCGKSFKSSKNLAWIDIREEYWEDVGGLWICKRCWNTVGKDFGKPL